MLVQPSVAALARMCALAPAVAMLLAAASVSAAEPMPQILAAEHARTLAATCTACHGPAIGMPAGGDDVAFAPLAGRPAGALLAQLRAYREGKLAGTLMPQLAKGYTDAELVAIAAYFANQPAAER